MKKDSCRYNQTRGMKDFKTICIYGIKIEESLELPPNSFIDVPRNPEPEHCEFCKCYEFTDKDNEKPIVLRSSIEASIERAKSIGLNLVPKEDESDDDTD